MMTFLETSDDLTWLRSVHMRDCVVPPFTCAILEGQEDCPSKITLYEANDINSNTLELLPDAEGRFHCRQERY